MITRLSIGGFLIGALIGMAVLPGQVAPQDPLIQDLDDAGLSPGEGHPLGTDALGRDVMSRVVYGASVSLPVAGAATCVACLIGMTLGFAAGGAGRRADRALTRVVDVVILFPTLLLLVTLAALFPIDTPFALVILLGLTTWTPIARLVRAETRTLSMRGFVEAARSLGASRARSMATHLAPGLVGTVGIAAVFLAGDMILLESGLSYLGLGVAPPFPTWGDMVREGMQDLAGAWWISFFPGCALVLAVTGLNLVADGLQDALRAPFTGAPARIPDRG